MTTNVLPGGVVRETLIGKPPPPVNINQAVRETLYALPPPPVRVMMVVRETLYPGFANVRAVVFL